MAEKTITPLPQSPPAGSRRRAWRDVIALSLVVTAAAALFALAVTSLADARWGYVFVMTRWMVVFALLALPLLHQVASRRGLELRLPWAIRTPATALVLTLEGIAYDIVSANVSG